MSLRAKLLLVFVTSAVLPLLALSVLNYLGGARAVEGALREDAEKDAALMSRRIEATLDARENDLLKLSRTLPFMAYAGEASRGPRAPVTDNTRGDLGASPLPVPDALRESADAFFRFHRDHLHSITCFDANGRPLFRLEGATGADDEVRFQSEDFVTSALHYDTRVRSLTGAQVLRSPLAHEAYGTAMRLAVPVFDGVGSQLPHGALVVELNLDAILKESAGDGVASDRAAPDASRDTAADTEQHPPHAPRRAVVALDNETGRILYHTNSALIHQPFSSTMPFFGVVAGKMMAGASGTGFYNVPGGDSWLAAFGQVKSLNISLAVAEDYSAASAGARGAGLFGIALAALAGTIGCALTLLIMKRAARRIELVAEGAAAIAGGNLDQHIELHTGGATNALVENFNRMSERLRELIAREAESKQFESFMRLSAMLTHDLKNAITGLTMLVSNMERHFHREEFRAGAVLSLREATEKLNRIVARLSEPAKSLSGEYRRAARPADLVAVIKRVLAVNAEPYASLYRIEARLPDTLVATIEPERIEAVVENLIINALEAMGARGGTLTVEAGREGDRHVFFGVADTGVGISDEFIRTRLFRPFATTKSKGIGLGLFTCREIVEAHGGRITTESKLGAGTRFRVVLPSGLFASGERHGAATGEAV